MSFELRLKKLKETWMKVQAERDNITKLMDKRNKLKTELRSIAQLIPKKQQKMEELLEKFNETMV